MQGLTHDLLGLSCVGPWALARTIRYVTNSGPLIKLRTGSMIFRLNYGKFWINIVISDEALSNCLGLLHVAPYLLFTVTSFLAKEFLRAKFFLPHNVPFPIQIFPVLQYVST